jgi:hypothetical protein
MKMSSVLCWLIVVSVLVTAWPQSQPTQPPEVNHPGKPVETEHSKNIESQVRSRGTGEKATVKVTLQDKSIVKGYISKVDAESFGVTDKKSGHVTTIAYGDVAKVKKTGLSTGAKVGIAVGVTAGALIGVGAVLGSVIND